MKICMLAPEFLPAWGGVGTYIVDLLRHLPSDVDVHVVTPMRESLGQDRMANHCSFRQYFGSNVKIHFVCNASDTFFYNARFQHACLTYVPELIKREGIDVIHSHTAHMPDMLLMFKRLKVPILTTVHTTIRTQRLGTASSHMCVSDFERTEKATYFMYPVLRLTEELYFRKNRFYTSPSEWMKRWLEENSHINPDQIRVIPNSVDIADLSKRGINIDFEPSRLKDKRFVLYTGRLLAMKGVNTLMRAIPKVLQHDGTSDVLFVFAGPGKRNSYLDALKQMNVEQYCLFTGPLWRDAVISLMRMAEVVVVPSYLENCPYVILESMACGTPVIASNVGGIPELVENNYNGLLVESGSPDALANAIVDVVTDRFLRNLMGQRAKKIVSQKFSWAVNVSKYLEVYSEAMNQ